MNKTSIIVFLVSVLAVGGLIWLILANKEPDPEPLALDACVQHEQDPSVHIHSTLSIFIEGQQIPVPSNIGVSTSCMSPVHTHDATGKIHVEYPDKHDFTLGDFFDRWGQTFTQDKFLDNKIDSKHVITMTVDGKQSDLLQDLVLKDDQEIKIEYKTL